MLRIDMKSITFGVSSVFPCALLIICVWCVRAETKRNVDVKDTVIHSSDAFSGKRGLSNTLFDRRHKSARNDARQFGSLIGPGRSHTSHEHVECKDCFKGDSKRDLTQSVRPTPGSRQLPEIFIRVRTFTTPESHVPKHTLPEDENRRGLLQHDAPSPANLKRFQNRLERTVKKLERQRHRLVERLHRPDSENRNYVKQRGKFRFSNSDSIKSKSVVNPSWPRKRSHDTVGEEQNFSLRAARGNDGSRHQPVTDRRPYPGKRDDNEAPVLAKDNGTKSDGTEAMPQDEAMERLNGDKESSMFSESEDRGENRRGNRLVRPAMADRLENSGKTLLESVHNLRRHTHALMKAFVASKHQLNTHHEVIYNGTRYTMALGVRGAVDMIHDANDYIIDGVNKAYQVTVRESLRYHLERERRRNFPQDEAALSNGQETEAFAILDRIKSKDFYSQKKQAETQEEEVLLFEASIYSLESKSSQDKAEMERVRRKFDSGDYLRSVRGARYYLNDVIRTVNSGFLYSRAMRQLRFQKRLLDATYNIREEANDKVRKSYTALRTSISKQEESRRLAKQWLARRGRRSGRNDLTASKEMRDLGEKVKASGLHAMLLRDQVNRELRNLVFSVNEAEKFLSQPTGQNTEMRHSTERLKHFIPEMYTALEEIGNLTGSNVTLTRPKRCIPEEVYEGSGNGAEDDVTTDGAHECEGGGNDDMKLPSSDSKEADDDDDDDDKSSDGGGFFASWFGSSNNNNNENDDDFSFEESEPVVKTEDQRKVLKSDKRRQNVATFNRDIKTHTFESLKDSQEIHKDARSLNVSLNDLRQDWEQIQQDVAGIAKTIDSQKALNSKLEATAMEIHSVTSRIEQLQNGPSTLQLNNVMRRAKMIERKFLARATGKEEPNEGWMDDYYTLNYYVDDEYYYDDEGKTSESKTEEYLAQRDAAVADYEELHQKGRQIQTNYGDIERLRNLAVASCGRVSTRLGTVHGNLTALRRKVHKARDMLSAMQLSISKTGEGHIAIPLQDKSEEDSREETSMRLCIKPKSLDGPILVVQGNQSASYSLSLAGGVITAGVYDADWSTLHQIIMENALEKDTWYTIQLQRIRQYFVASVHQKDQVEESESKRIVLEDLKSTRSRPAIAYVGGIPTDIDANIDSVRGSWDGCVGDLIVDGRSLTLYTPGSEGLNVSLCDSHCATSKDDLDLSTVFNGDGFLRHNRPVGADTTSVTFAFTTHQQTASLVSVVNKSEGFYLHVMLDAGALRVQISSERKSVLYLSSNQGYGDGKSHKVKVEIRDSANHITVDEAKDEFQVKSSKPVLEKESLQGILIGAFVSVDRRFYHNEFRPFIGCMSDVTVNGEGLVMSQAHEVHNVYKGSCRDAQHHIWHSCRQWSEKSSSIVLQEVSHSNAVSLWVSANATGPVMRYIRKDDFTVDVIVNSDGLGVSVGGSSKTLNRPTEEKTDFFFVSVVDETSSSNVEVVAWGQSVEYTYSYSWWYASSDSNKPHSLIIAGEQDGEDSGGYFAGSLSKIMIENRFLDLSQYKESNKIEMCPRPIEELHPQEEEEEDSLPLISCS